MKLSFATIDDSELSTSMFDTPVESGWLKAVAAEHSKIRSMAMDVVSSVGQESDVETALGLFR